MKKLVLCFIILLSVALIGMNCYADSSTEKNIIKLRLGGTVPDENPITMSLYKFAELVNEKTKGIVEVTVYPNVQLGGAREMFEAVQLGNLDMIESGSMVLGGFTDKFSFMNLPYLFKSREAAFEFINSDTGQALINRIAEETNLYALSWVENGFFQITNSTKPLIDPVDLKDMKFRVQESEVFLNVFRILGTNSITMSFPELFTALQQKVIEGQLNSAVLILTSKLYEPQKFLTNTNIFYDLTGIFINKDLFDGFSPDIQKALLDSAKEATDYQLGLVRIMEGDAFKKLEKVINVTYLTEEQREKWVEAARPAYDWYRDKYKDPYFDSYIEEINKINMKY